LHGFITWLQMEMLSVLCCLQSKYLFMLLLLYKHNWQLVSTVMKSFFVVGTFSFVVEIICLGFQKGKKMFSLLNNSDSCFPFLIIQFCFPTVYCFSFPEIIFWLLRSVLQLCSFFLFLFIDLSFILLIWRHFIHPYMYCDIFCSIQISLFSWSIYTALFTSLYLILLYLITVQVTYWFIFECTINL
jgi:hypothetical protein